MSLNPLIKNAEKELSSVRNIRKMAMNQVHLNHIIVDQTLQREHDVKGHLRALQDMRNLEKPEDTTTVNVVQVNPPKHKTTKKVLRFKPGTVRHVTGKVNGRRTGFILRGVQRALYEVNHNVGSRKLSFQELVNTLKDHMQRRTLPESVVINATDVLLKKGILKEQPKGYVTLA